jgi:WD40 repeat protein
MEVTQTCFSPVSIQRLFTASLDKTMRVYDLPSKQLLKQIQTPSPILLMTVDFSEKQVYLACDNLNVY